MLWRKCQRTRAILSNQIDIWGFSIDKLITPVRVRIRVQGFSLYPCPKLILNSCPNPFASQTLLYEFVPVMNMDINFCPSSCQCPLVSAVMLYKNKNYLAPSPSILPSTLAYECLHRRFDNAFSTIHATGFLTLIHFSSSLVSVTAPC